MKVRASVKPMCKHCRLIIRGNRMGKKVRRIVCKIKKHKQRQG